MHQLVPPSRPGCASPHHRVRWAHTGGGGEEMEGRGYNRAMSGFSCCAARRGGARSSTAGHGVDTRLRMRA
ncbi:MAG: hypothetical protein EOO41_00955 [Methanobacteriota archaeon]|nr:MAG: hypothetical protein EOO41_00955 [Euryarchaeota archaeon]